MITSDKERIEEILRYNLEEYLILYLTDVAGKYGPDATFCEDDIFDIGKAFCIGFSMGHRVFKHEPPEAFPAIEPTALSKMLPAICDNVVKHLIKQAGIPVNRN